MLSLGYYKPDVYLVALSHYVLKDGRHVHAGNNVSLTLEKWRLLMSMLGEIEADIEAHKLIPMENHGALRY